LSITVKMSSSNWIIIPWIVVCFIKKRNFLLLKGNVNNLFSTTFFQTLFIYKYAYIHILFRGPNIDCHLEILPLTSSLRSLEHNSSSIHSN
jgi:hypothetical protein